MAIDLSKIKKKLAQLQMGNNASKYTWKPPVGKTIIRIVPYQYNSDDCFIELLFHYGISKKNPLSLETFHEEDPIVEFSEKLKSSGDQDDWKLGKKLEPKLRAYVPIIVRGKEKEGVKYWGFGKELYQELMNIMLDPDYGDITDLNEGRDMTVEFVSAKDAGNSYGKISFLMKPNKSKATTDSTVLDLINTKQVNMFDIYKKPTYQELQDVLEAWLNPENTKDSETEETTDTESDTEVEETEVVAETEVETETEVVPEKPVVTPKVKTETVKPKVDASKIEAKKADSVGAAFDELFS